jgi:hypothetical protein
MIEKPEPKLLGLGEVVLTSKITLRENATGRLLRSKKQIAQE